MPGASICHGENSAAREEVASPVATHTQLRCKKASKAMLCWPRWLCSSAPEASRGFWSFCGEAQPIGGWQKTEPWLPRNLRVLWKQGVGKSELGRTAFCTGVGAPAGRSGCGVDRSILAFAEHPRRFPDTPHGFRWNCIPSLPSLHPSVSGVFKLKSRTMAHKTGLRRQRVLFLFFSF